MRGSFEDFTPWWGVDLGTGTAGCLTSAPAAACESDAHALRVVTLRERAIASCDGSGLPISGADRCESCRQWAQGAEQ